MSDIVKWLKREYDTPIKKYQSKDNWNTKELSIRMMIEPDMTTYTIKSHLVGISKRRAYKGDGSDRPWIGREFLYIGNDVAFRRDGRMVFDGDAMCILSKNDDKIFFKSSSMKTMKMAVLERYIPVML